MTAAAQPQAPKDTTTFYLLKGRVRAILIAVSLMQKRDDTSGKFAKKLGRQRRALAAADEEVTAQRADIENAHTERDEKGEPLPVYAEKEDGAPIFTKDAAGNDTAERLVVPGQIRLKDRKQYESDIKAMLKETIAITCPAFLVPADAAKDGIPELERFKAIKGDIIDALMDLEEDADTTRPPLALVADEPAAVIEDPIVTEVEQPAAEEDRTAP